MEKEDKVYIPKNVKKRLEFFRGFGVKELIITLFMATILIVPSIFLYRYVSQAFGISFFLIIVATTIMLVVKDENDISFYKQLILVLKSIFMQKEFKYRERKRK